MSRTYKKTPYCGDNKGKTNKRIANKKVRMFLKNFNEVLKYSDYKKISETYNICDYYWIKKKKNYWKRCLKNYYEYNSAGIKTEYPDKKEKYRRWYKMYKMK